MKGMKLQKKILNEFLEKSIIQERSNLSFRELNEALMDLGRVLCQSKKASCSLCPLRKNCVAHINKKELQYPVTDQKSHSLVKEDLFVKVLRIIVKDKSKVLLYQKSDKEWLSGQWELPTFAFETNDLKFKQYPAVKNKKKFCKIRYN